MAATAQGPPDFRSRTGCAALCEMCYNPRMNDVADIPVETIVGKLRELAPALKAEGVTGLALFGSRARGDARPGSDLDILVEVPPDARFSLLNLIGVEHIIGDATGLQAQATMRRSLPPRFAERIADDILEVF